MNAAPVFLLVEPSPILRSSLHDWLQQAFPGHRILVAANGVEGLRLAVQERPSHILVEMELPEKTGFDVLRQIRQALPDAVVVATGWYESRDFLDKVRAAGANGFIRKHKLPSELLPLWNVPPE
jgi:two-component system, NarL family, response regulator NreC